MTHGRLVCISGRSGSGKDTAGTYLNQHHGFVRVAIADHLKWTVMNLFQLNQEQLWGEGRNIDDPRLKRPPRLIYQQFGDACRAIDPEVWLGPWCHRVESLRKSGFDVVCTDLRTLEELTTGRNMGGAIWHMERKNSGAPGIMGEHFTETALGYALDLFDHIITNNETKDDLFQNIDSILKIK